MLQIPIYELTLDDDALGIYTISLVASPAMEHSWIAFDKQERIQCSIINEEEHKVMCVICRCDFPIYRCDERGEYYVIYHRDTIQQMAQKFLKQGYQTEINIEHDENSYVDGVELQEIFIKNSDKGISPKGFEDVEEGSLMGVYKIENNDIWAAIKKGVFTSVSLEGLFTIKKEEPKNITISNIKDLFDWLNNK